jgi:prepilin-type N-terminal cleavage/methylation domain-containing protein
MDRRPDRDDGFSVIEVLTVVAVLGILVTVAIATYQVSTGASRRVACLSNQRVLMQGILIFRSQNDGEGPASIDDLRPLVRWPGNGPFGACTSEDALPLIFVPPSDVSCPNHP